MRLEFDRSVAAWPAQAREGQMSESFPSPVTFPNGKSGSGKTNGMFPLMGVDPSLRTSHETFSNLDSEASADSSAESTVAGIPVSEIFSDSDRVSRNRVSRNRVTVYRPPADIDPTDNNPVGSDPAGSATLASNTQRSFKPAPTARARLAMRLFRYPNLRRFAPAA